MRKKILDPSTKLHLLNPSHRTICCSPTEMDSVAPEAELDSRLHPGLGDI